MTDGKTQILVIDDEQSFCELVRELLVSANYEVSIANSVEEAEPMVEATSFSAILLDVVMPGESGVAFLERMQAKRTVCPPVIMVTGHPNMGTAVRSIKCGAVDYLSKPTDPDKLIATVDRAVGLSAMRRSERTVVMTDAAKYVAGYRIKKVLGGGTMGMVYLVEKPGQTEGPEEYALKVLKRLAAQTEDDLNYVKERFMLEARATHGIEHPNVIRVFDYGTTEQNLPYIVLEYCPGKTLEELIAEGSLNLAEKCRILMQIAMALDAIHKQHVCHRDVKPSNVIVRKDLRAKLTDFGIARLHDSNLTMTSEVFGSPAFLSPEGFASAKVDHRADIFSFGSMAYQLFTGKLPFEGDDIAVICNKIRNEDPAWPSETDPSFPPPLERMLKRMLAKNPDDRFQRGHEIYMALGSFMRKLGMETVTKINSADLLSLDGDD